MPTLWNRVFRTSPLVLAVCLLAPLTVTGQPEPGRWVFKNRNYFAPLIAEPRAARVMLGVPMLSDGFRLSKEPGTRRAWLINLGRELPIFGRQSVPLDAGGGGGRLLGAGEWGVGLWLPVSFHMIEDFKDPSNPIVNTDMRFGAMAKGVYSFTDDPRDCADVEFRRVEASRAPRGVQERDGDKIREWLGAGNWSWLWEGDTLVVELGPEQRVPEEPICTPPKKLSLQVTPRSRGRPARTRAYRRVCGGGAGGGVVGGRCRGGRPGRDRPGCR